MLLVGDNEHAAEGSRACSEASDMKVAVAPDGPDALRVAVAFAADVAVLDIGLPIMDGCELAGRLRERHRAARLR
ncbi:MAG: response regulator [Deltaproteobacteria bacterium]|nr:response regulator [Deltaproteobacteria bacterium]